MASPLILVNGTPVTGSVSVAANTTVNIALVSTSGVNKVELEFTGSSVLGSLPIIAPSGSPSGAAATFTSPNQPCALILEIKVNDGRNVEHQVDLTLRTKVKIYVASTARNLELFAYGEELEADPVYGWNKPLNALVLAVDAITEGGGGGGDESLSDALELGNVTNSHDIVFTSGDAIRGVDAAVSDDDGGGLALVAGIGLGTGSGGNVSITAGGCDSGATPGAIYLLPGQSNNEVPATGFVFVGGAIQLQDLTGQAALATPAGAGYLYVEGNELKFKDSTGTVKTVTLV